MKQEKNEGYATEMYQACKESKKIGEEFRTIRGGSNDGDLAR